MSASSASSSASSAGGMLAAAGAAGEVSPGGAPTAAKRSKKRKKSKGRSSPPGGAEKQSKDGSTGDGGDLVRRRKKKRRHRDTARLRLEKELAEISANPPSNCSAGPADGDLFSWIATMRAPDESPYKKGMFYLAIKFPKDYPFKPPQIKFTTKIYHCNVAGDGKICLDILKENWSPTLTIKGVLLSISSLLTDPNPEDPLVDAIAKEYISDRSAHDRKAREWTQRYAITRIPGASAGASAGAGKSRSR